MDGLDAASGAGTLFWANNFYTFDRPQDRLSGARRRN